MVSLKMFLLVYCPRILLPVKVKILKKYQIKSSLNAKTLGYILVSPELDTFSYVVLNAQEVGCEIGKFFGEESGPPDLLEEFEAIQFPVKSILTRILNLSHSKFRPKLGRHLTNYFAGRHFKPSLIIESGVRTGLGGFVLQKCIERNAQDNKSVQSQYLGIDVSKHAGHFLGTNKKSVLLHGDTLSVLDGFIKQNIKTEKLMFISDSVPGEQVYKELALAAKLVTNELLFVHNFGWANQLDIPQKFNEIKSETFWQETDHLFLKLRQTVLTHYIRKIDGDL